MRLKSVKVSEFRSVRESGEFEIGDVTCLVGKNESGKTALLHALYTLNPIVPEHGDFNVTNDYPRVDVEDYQQELDKGTISPANVTTAVYELEDYEVASVENDLGKGILRDRCVTIRRGYDNRTTFHLNIDEPVAVRRLVDGIDLPDDVRDQALRLGTLADLLSHLTKSAESKEAEYNSAVAAANGLADAAEQAKAKDDASRLRESEAAKQLRASLGSYTKKPLDTYIWEKYLRASWPKFLYFDEYYQMAGQVNIQKLKERQANKKLLDSDRPMLGLIELSRLNLDQLLAAKNTQELLNKIEGASNHLSKQILPYWSQNKHIQMRFELRPALPEDPEGLREGTNVWGFVYDTTHHVTTQLGTRSRGFVWFFSFVAWFSQQKKLNHPIILLLDEPGLILHASAQADLLRYIEEQLKPHHQVLYTTHSPFMVDATQFSRVQIVRDKSMESSDPLPKERQGTKVFTDVLEADEGSLFPLQGALGYDIAQTLFIGPNSLIVEGVSDLLYIQAMTALLQSDSKEGLSSSWTITPVGGSDKVPTFVALLGAQRKLKLAALIDLQTKDEQQIENLYKKKLLQKKNVHTFATFTGQSEADIEDMFEPQFYIGLVNAEYAAELSKPITVEDLTAKHPRLLRRIDEYLKQHPLKQGGFNHYRPARYFAENSSSLMPKLSAATLNRFERAFKAINSLL